MKTIVSRSMLVIIVLVLVACTPAATPTPEVIREEIIVTKEVEVIVTQEVEVVVTKEVEVEVEVPADVEVISINMGFIPDVQYAPWYVGVEKGYFAEEGLQLIFDYSDEVDGIELLAAGEREFAIGSGDLALQARSQGLPIIYVARWYNGIPSAIFSLKETGIEKPEDLAGKTVGLPGFFGINYKSYLAMLDAFGLTDEDVQTEAIGWAQIASVNEGVVDAAVGYSNNEPVQMASEGIEVNVIELNEWNDFVPIGIMTSEAVIEERPEMVQKLVRAFLRSHKDTLEDPEFALEAVIRAVQYTGAWNREKTAAALAKAIEFWTVENDEYGFYGPETFEWSQEFLLNAGEMDTAIDVTETYTNEFVENAQP